MSPEFSNHLEVCDTEKTGCWKLTKPFHYVAEGVGEIVHVPAGFITDFASIPRFLWALLPPTGKYQRAAVIHDYMYRTGARSRVVADAMFLEAMIFLGVPMWKRQLMYRAVRLFGRWSYKAMQKVSEDNNQKGESL